MRTLLWCVSVSLLLGACDERIAPLRPTPESVEPFVCDERAAPPESESLQWKRLSALTSDLEGALELGSNELCNELNLIPCAEVHRTALGSNDAFGAARYEPVASPLATTPSAVDRLVLSACENAVARDASGPPRVFTDLPPDDAALDITDASTANAIEGQIAALYRRLLMRDAEAVEIDLVRELALDASGAPRTARELDVLACFAIGTTSEMVLF